MVFNGITKIFLLVGSYPMLSWHLQRCLYSSTCENRLWDLDYITPKQHTKLYAQTVQGLVDYAQKYSLVWQHPTLCLLYGERLDGARLQ